MTLFPVSTLKNLLIMHNCGDHTPAAATAVAELVKQLERLGITVDAYAVGGPTKTLWVRLLPQEVTVSSELPDLSAVKETGFVTEVTPDQVLLAAPSAAGVNNATRALLGEIGFQFHNDGIAPPTGMRPWDLPTGRRAG